MRKTDRSSKTNKILLYTPYYAKAWYPWHSAKPVKIFTSRSQHYVRFGWPGV